MGDKAGGAAGGSSLAFALTEMGPTEVSAEERWDLNPSPEDPQSCAHFIRGQ